jgi:uncharacterized membrane protein YdjX (TVP38/TMEM64 family)
MRNEACSLIGGENEREAVIGSAMNGGGKIETKAGPGKFSLRRLAPLIVLALSAAAFFAFGLEDYLTFDMLRNNRRAILDFVAAKQFAAALIFIAVYAAGVIFVPPSGTVMTLLGGFIFGAVFATSYVVIGATIGATVLFLAARYSFGDYLHERAGPAVRKMESGFRENEISYMLVLRLIPLFPFWLVNIAPAFLNVRLRAYVIGTFIGIIPGTAVYAMVGSGLGSALDDAEDLSMAIIMKPEIIAGLAGLGLLALVPVAFKKLKARRK